ncbi:MAG: AraC family transcriptional regulator ligand-binding domain-containing protein [Phycisphaerae bacterium]
MNILPTNGSGIRPDDSGPHNGRPVGSVCQLRALCRAATRAGVDCRRIILDLGLNPTCIADDINAVAPVAVICEAFEAAAEAAADPFLGLRAAQDYRPADLQALGYAIDHQPNLRASLTFMVNHIHEYSHAVDLSFAVDASRARLAYQLVEPRVRRKRQRTEYAIGCLIQIIRRIVGESWHPLEVHFEHDDRGMRRNYAAMLGCRVVFDHYTNAVHFDASALTTVNRHADAELLPFLTAQLGRSAAACDPEMNFVTRVRRSIDTLLGDDAPTETRVANTLDVGERTLRRRLTRHGTSFKQLVDEVRYRRALALLERRDMSLAEVARLLGYSSQSCFTRSFRRWTGSTPTTFRHRRN